MSQSHSPRPGPRPGELTPWKCDREDEGPCQRAQQLSHDTQSGRGLRSLDISVGWKAPSLQINIDLCEGVQTHSHPDPLDKPVAGHCGPDASRGTEHSQPGLLSRKTQQESIRQRRTLPGVCQQIKNDLEEVLTTNINGTKRSAGETEVLFLLTNRVG